MDKDNILLIVVFIGGLITGGSTIGMVIGEGPFWDGFRDTWFFGLGKWLQSRSNRG